MLYRCLLQKGQLFHNGRNGRETKAATAPRIARSRRRRLEARKKRQTISQSIPSLPTFSQLHAQPALGGDKRMRLSLRGCPFSSPDGWPSADAASTSTGAARCAAMRSSRFDSSRATLSVLGRRAMLAMSLNVVVVSCRRLSSYSHACAIIARIVTALFLD
jgi:hypothetical protein